MQVKLALAGDSLQRVLQQLPHCDRLGEDVCVSVTSKRFREREEVETCFGLDRPALKRYKEDLKVHYCKDPDNMMKLLRPQLKKVADEMAE